jgi:hypothetical protein
MAIIDVKTYTGPFVNVVGRYDPVAKTVDTLSATPNGRLIAAKEFRYEVASQDGEQTQYVAVLPTTTTLPVNSQAVVLGGNPLESMVFENVAGAITYRGQASIPIRTSIKPIADVFSIGTAMPVGTLYWYLLTQADGTNQPGYYSIESTGFVGLEGIESGPFLSPSGGSAADSRTVFIVRANATASVAPTATEKPSPIEGDAAVVFLNNGTKEYWSYGTAWVLRRSETAAASSGGDATYQIATRANSTQSVAPSAAELTAANGGTLPSMLSGQDAIVPLQDGSIEYWMYDGSAWVRQRILATATNTSAGLLHAGLIAGSGATLPTTAARIGQLFWLDGVGLYSALDLVGNWVRIASVGNAAPTSTFTPVAGWADPTAETVVDRNLADGTNLDNTRVLCQLIRDLKTLGLLTS